MGNLLAYSGLVTKVHAMQAKLLTPAQYKELASLHNVTEVYHYLKEQSAYSIHFQDITDANLHRGDIEKLLIQSLYSDYSRLYSFSGVAQQQFLKLYLKRYEVDLINYCFRIIFNHYDEPFDLNHKKAFFNKYSQISIDKLITSRTMQELVENLKDTEYYEPLKKLNSSNATTLFDYDLALDLYYYSTLWKNRKKIFKGRELETITTDTGTKIDLLNLQWIYRAKRYYNMDEADIYSMLIPIQYHIHFSKLKELVETSSLEEFAAVVRTTSYTHKYPLEQPIALEAIYTDCLDHLYRLDRRRNPYSIATLNTYLFLKEEELKKLTTVLECARYGISGRETLNYLGGVIK
ncbi:MAG: V-type ATPase subunit [Lachnospiraceae bacterium]